ncbi:MAG TPA: efflux RND transporter periplasmic adaptor subunit [Polyangiales bacterium]
MAREDGSGDPEVMRTLGADGPLQRRVRMLALWLGLVLGVVALGFFGNRWYQARERAKQPRYVTEPAARADVQVIVSATGTLKGQNTVEVGAEVSGRVAKVYADFNDRVTQGQLLLEIDPEQARASVDEARARVAEADAATKQAQASLQEARQNAARGEQQAAQGLVSQKELEAVRAALARGEASVDSAKASAQMARATLKSQVSRLEKTRILSPISGVVLARLVEPGQTVNAGMTTPVLFKLAEDLRRMSLYVYIDEADVGRTREGQPASFTVDAYPDKVFPSKLISLRNEPKEDQNVVSYEAVLAVDNDALLLRPGMTATATIVADKRSQVLTVPNAALRFTPPSRGREPAGKQPQGRGVWTQEGDTPRFIPLKTGASDGQRSEVIGGKLEPGTRLLVDVVEEKKK